MRLLVGIGTPSRPPRAARFGVCVAASLQATGRDRGVQLRAVGAAGVLLTQLNRYPAEALESLCHTVRGDELDARRATLPPASCFRRDGMAGRGAAPYLLWWRCVLRAAT